MRKTAVIPALALLLLTGCGSDATGSGPAEPAGTSEAAAEAAEPAAGTTTADSEEAACLKLLGSDGNGPLYRAIYSVNDDGATFGFEGPAESVSSLGGELRGIADGAPKGMDTPLEELTVSLEGAAQLIGNPASAADFDIYAWRGAVTELLTRCAPYESTGAAASAEPATTPATAAAAASAAYPGYPMVVNGASVDYRVAAWFDGRLADGLLVALAPGLYTPYDPGVPDLTASYLPEGTAGDRTMKATIFPGAGGAATWAGVLPGSEEPQ